jgi:UDP-3-O-[3-hydroxymyristoyl] glucosamine N-acyltransferase
MKLKEIAEIIGGTIQGDGDVEIGGVSSIEEQGPGTITYLQKKKFLPSLHQSQALAVIVREEVETDKAQVLVANPALAFARAVNAFHPPKPGKPGVHVSANIGENVTLGQGVTISPQVCIGDNVVIGDGVILHPGVVIGEECRIGKQSILHAHVTLYPETVLGDEVVLHAGVVIGVDGFGYVPDEQGEHYKINQVGSVVIEDKVEVGANSCIDRAALGITLIKKGTKIDNLVQVAHNCVVGEHSILVAQVGMAGSCKLGHHVVLAGQVGLADHVTIGNQAILTAQAGTFRDVEDGGVVSGSPGVPINVWKKYVSILPKLPDMAKKIKGLDARLKAIEKDESDS